MAKSSIEKTNVMRLLDQKKVPYTPHTYPHGDDAVDGVTVAQMTGMDPAKVFKTLVARGARSLLLRRSRRRPSLSAPARSAIRSRPRRRRSSRSCVRPRRS